MSLTASIPPTAVPQASDAGAHIRATGDGVAATTGNDQGQLADESIEQTPPESAPAPEQNPNMSDSGDSREEESAPIAEDTDGDGLWDPPSSDDMISPPPEGDLNIESNTDKELARQGCETCADHRQKRAGSQSQPQAQVQAQGQQVQPNAVGNDEVEDEVSTMGFFPRSVKRQLGYIINGAVALVIGYVLFKLLF